MCCVHVCVYKRRRRRDYADDDDDGGGDRVDHDQEYTCREREREERQARQEKSQKLICGMFELMKY